MPIAAGIGAVGAIGSAFIGANAAGKASDAQAQMGQQALSQQNALSQQGLQTLLSMFNTAKGAIQPAIDTGNSVLGSGRDIINSALPTLTNLLTPGPNQTATLSQLPGFQFAQDWGQKAVQNIGSTTGLGGNVLKAGADYATGAASQGFSGLTGMLQALLGSGINLTGTGGNILTSGTNALASAATGTGSNAFNNLTQTGANEAQTYTGIGNAQASGILGQANALSGGLTGGGNSVTNAMLLSKLFPGAGGAAGGSTSSGIYGGGSGVPYMNAPFSGGS